MFSRYGEIPVDLSTGVPSIGIPIHTISEGKITLPISLSYHASGIKISDISNEVGIGWVLNCGGVITRTVLGQQDELTNNIIPLYTNANDLNAAIQSAPVYQQYELATAIHWNYMKVFNPITDSFSDFISLYMENSEKLYP